MKIRLAQKIKHFKIYTYWHRLFRPMPKAWFTLTTKCNAKLKFGQFCINFKVYLHQKSDCPCNFDS